MSKTKMNNQEFQDALEALNRDFNEISERIRKENSFIARLKREDEMMGKTIPKHWHKPGKIDLKSYDLPVINPFKESKENYKQ